MIELLLAHNSYCQFHFNNKWNEHPCTVTNTYDTTSIELGNQIYTLKGNTVCASDGVCEEVKVQQVTNNVFGRMKILNGTSFAIHYRMG